MAEIRKGYKETEIGVIPEDWEVKPLDHFVANINKKYEQNDKDIPYIGLEHLEVATGKLLGIGNISQIKSSKNTFSKGDILFGKLRPYLRKYYNAEFEGACSTEILVLRPNKNCAFPYYLIQRNNFIDTVSNQSYGTKMPRTSWKQMRSFLFPTPPLDEQEKIAEILSSTDKHIEDLDRLIEDYELLKKGMMQKLLTEGIGHSEFKDTEIGRIPKEWEVKRIKDICEIGRGRVISKKTIENSKGIYPVYSSQTTNNGCMGYIDTFDFEGEYVTWTTDGVNAGSTFYRSGRFNCTNVCGTLKLKDDTIISHRFLALILNNFTDKYVVRNGNPKLMNNIMALIQIPISKSIKEQNKIADSINSVENTIDQLKESKDNYTNLKQALMDRLLTGKIRVV